MDGYRQDNKVIGSLRLLLSFFLTQRQRGSGLFVYFFTSRQDRYVAPVVLHSCARFFSQLFNKSEEIFTVRSILFVRLCILCAPF